MIGIALEIQTTCTQCEEALNVNALVPAITCEVCGAVNSYPVELWQSILKDVMEEVLKMKKDEETEETTFTRGKRELDITYGRQNPRDPKTETALDISTLVAAVDAGYVFANEGQRISVRKVPAEYQAFLPNVTVVVGEEEKLLPRYTTPAAAPRCERSVTLHCYNCGNPLIADGSEPEITCDKCHARTTVPDELWEKLHPTQDPHRWYLLFDESKEPLFNTEGQAVEWDDVADLIIDENGFLYLTCQVGDSESVSVVSFTPELGVRWVQSEIKMPLEDDDDHPARLALVSENRLLLHGGGRGTMYFLSRNDGRVMTKHKFEKSDKKLPPRLAPKMWTSAFQDLDGTWLAYYGTSDIDANDILNGPVRFTLNGEELPVCRLSEKGKIGLFFRIFKKMAGLSAVAFVDVGDLPYRIFDPEVYIQLAGDGTYFFVSYDRLARFARDGKKIYFCKVPEGDNLSRLGVDGEGGAYFISGEKLWRISPDGKQTETLSELTRRGGCLGEEKLVARAKDGTLYLFGESTRVRILNHDRRPRYVSKQSREDDAADADTVDFSKDD